MQFALLLPGSNCYGIESVIPMGIYGIRGVGCRIFSMVMFNDYHAVRCWAPLE